MVSVIIPIYNTEKYLNSCIESVVNQLYADIEIILVNDGSTDNCDSICNEWKEKDSRIVYLKQNNSGPSAARNNGISNASGEYIVFVDSDDCVDKEYISLLVEVQNNNPNREILTLYTEFTGGIDAINEKVCEFGTTDYEKSDVIRLFDRSLLNSPCNKLYNREIILNKGILFDDKIVIGEDLIFNIDYIENYNIKGFTIIERPLYFYRRGLENSLTSKYHKNYYEHTNYQYQRLMTLAKTVGATEKTLDRLGDRIDDFAINVLRYNMNIKELSLFKILSLNTKVMKNHNVANIIKKKDYSDRIKKYMLPVYSSNNYYLVWIMEPILDAINSVRHLIMGK